MQKPSNANDLVRGWAPVYPHLRYAEPEEAIAWLARVFGFVERVRMAVPGGPFITSKLETPGGGPLLVAGSPVDFAQWLRKRVPNVRVPNERPWPHVSHAITVMLDDVDAHYRRATAEGATTIEPPLDHPWGLRTYAALDLEGHQWEFAQVLQIVEPESWGAVRLESSM